MTGLTSATRQLLGWRPGGKQQMLGRCSRLIYSQTGVWPLTDDELSHDTKKEIDASWKEKYQTLWQEPDKEEYSSSSSKGKKYVLSMFPYPSGKLHLGHVRVYATGDAMARFYRHRGYKVIHPIGWDAFGLPAENAAIDSGEMPQRWTHANIHQMRQQLQQLGCSFEWHREMATCDPDYYRWTQSLFLRLFRAGLAYQEEALVNWDPVDQTVLANEQVDEQGCSWRSGARVEQRHLRQWYIRLTRFSQSLLDGLSDGALENWRDITKIQRHWLGECSGYRVVMAVVGPAGSQGGPPPPRLNLWMAQPELLYGVGFIGVRSSHSLNTQPRRGQGGAGGRVLEVHAVCPLSQRKIPVVVSDSLPYAEDTDVHVGLPSLSEQDAGVARQCGLTIPHVTAQDRVINSGELSGLSLEEARQQVTQRLLQEGAGGFPTSAKLKDWLISRQRYWGTPIPIIHCPECGPVAVPEDQLPVLLPPITHFPKRGVSPLTEAQDWLRCPCPRCGREGQRETDTMDTFVDSSWYFLRFLDPQNRWQPFSHHLQEDLMPVDLYIGGKEHAVLHMLYARFMQHFLASEGVVSHWEPFRRLVMMGMVMAPTYKVKDSGRYLTRDLVDFTVQPPVELGTGAALVVTSEKMSKSKHNGIDPQEVLDKYGTDTTRLLMLASFAPASPRSWSEETFPGILSWQNRLWRTVTEFITTRQNCSDLSSDSMSPEERQEYEQHLWNARNHILSNTTYVLEHTHQLNAAISFMQALTISLRKVPRVMMLSECFERALAAQIIMLAPLTPHFASELWAGFCSVAADTSLRPSSLMHQPWPEVDQDYPLPLKYSITGEEPRQVKVPRRVLDHLTPGQALELISEDKSFRQHLQERSIVDTRLQVWPGLRASVSFTYSVHDVARAREQMNKRKEEKKKQKQMKKLKKKQGTVH